MTHDTETLPPADEGRLDRRVRPLRWLCQSCDWIGDDSELLRAPSPFDATDTIVGCPKCKAVEDIANACDEPGCTREATCGFPDPGGYRRTCGEHFKYERPNVRAERPAHRVRANRSGAAAGHATAAR